MGRAKSGRFQRSHGRHRTATPMLSCNGSEDEGCESRNSTFGPFPPLFPSPFSFPSLPFSPLSPRRVSQSEGAFENITGRVFCLSLMRSPCVRAIEHPRVPFSNAPHRVAMVCSDVCTRKSLIASKTIFSVVLRGFVEFASQNELKHADFRHALPELMLFMNF